MAVFGVIYIHYNLITGIDQRYIWTCNCCILDFSPAISIIITIAYAITGNRIWGAVDEYDA